MQLKNFQPLLVSPMTAPTGSSMTGQSTVTRRNVVRDDINEMLDNTVKVLQGDSRDGD